MSKILTAAQARAVYAALCELNNVSTRDGISIRFPGIVDRQYTNIEISEPDHMVLKVSAFDGKLVEHFDGQAAFAAAYNLEI
jgi:hypothetical protein